MNSRASYFGIYTAESRFADNRELYTRQLAEARSRRNPDDIRKLERQLEFYRNVDPSINHKDLLGHVIELYRGHAVRETKLESFPTEEGNRIFCVNLGAELMARQTNGNIAETVEENAVKQLGDNLYMKGRIYRLVPTLKESSEWQEMAKYVNVVFDPAKSEYLATLRKDALKDMHPCILHVWTYRLIDSYLCPPSFERVQSVRRRPKSRRDVWDLRATPSPKTKFSLKYSKPLPKGFSFPDSKMPQLTK
jgi:hypothetical protein